MEGSEEVEVVRFRLIDLDIGPLRLLATLGHGFHTRNFGLLALSKSHFVFSCAPTTPLCEDHYFTVSQAGNLLVHSEAACYCCSAM